MRALGTSLPTGSLWPARVILHPGSVRSCGSGKWSKRSDCSACCLRTEPIGLQSGFYPQAMLASGDGLWTPENLSTCSLYNLFEKTLRLQLWRAEDPRTRNRRM